MAFTNILYSIVALHKNCVTLNFFSGYGFIDIRLKGICAEDAYDKGLIIDECIFRPFDELRKVVKKNRFNVILG